MHRVSDEHNTDTPLHSEYSDSVLLQTNDDTHDIQSLPAYWTVRRPDEVFSDSWQTIPHAYAHGKHRTSRSTSYSPLHITSDVYSTDNRNVLLSSNKGPNHIRVDTLYSRTRTFYHFPVRLHGRTTDFGWTTSDPSDAMPSNGEGRSRSPLNHTVSLGYNTHTIRHFQYVQEVIPVRVHTSYNQTRTSYCCSNEPPPVSLNFSYSIRQLEGGTQTISANTPHRW